MTNMCESSDWCSSPKPLSYPLTDPRPQPTKARLIPNLFAPSLNTGFVTLVLCAECSTASKNRLIRAYPDNSTSCLFYLCTQCTHFNAVCQSYVYQKK